MSTEDPATSDDARLERDSRPGESPTDPSPGPEQESPAEEPVAGSARSFGLQSRDVVPVIAAASGVAAAFTGQEPTGNIVADTVLTVGFGAAVPWIGQRSRPQALVLGAFMALFFSAFGLPAVIFGLAALAVALYITTGARFDADSWAIGAALTAALTTHAALFFPNVGFVGSASLLAVGALAPIVTTGFVQLPEAQRRLTRRVFAGAAVYAVVASVLAVVVALSARSQVESGIEQAEEGVTAVEQGDRELALSLLDAAQQDFEAAGGRLGGPLVWPSRIVPIAAQHSRALETAAEQGASLVTTASRTVTRADVEKIRGQNGAIDLAIVEGVNAELSLATRTLIEARASLAEVNTPWLLPLLGSRLADVDDELAATAADIDLANHATAVLPNMLGANGPRRYLVLFVQPAESRELGGFVGAYALLDVVDGRFDLTESGSMGEDFGNAPAELTDPEAFPVPYLRILPQRNPQNLTSIADLSTIAAAAIDLAPQWRNDPEFRLDGVITIDPYALAGMLELTGPITIEGRQEPIDATNVVEFLLRGQYIEFDAGERDERQDALRVLAGEAFDQLLKVDIPGPERLGAIFGPPARANRLAMVTTDPLENAFLERVFLSADMPEVGSLVDMVGIYSQTATASKLDAFAHRTIEYVVNVDPATGSVSGHLTIVDTNDAPPDADAFVLGLSAPPAPDGGTVPIGDNVLFLGLYTRADVTPFKASGVFTLPESLPAFTYTRHPIGYIVPLGESVTITTTLTSTVEPGRYDLFLPAQATANPVDFRLRIEPAPGWRVIAPDADSDGSITREFELDEARGFSFVFEPS